MLCKILVKKLLNLPITKQLPSQLLSASSTPHNFLFSCHQPTWKPKSITLRPPFYQQSSQLLCVAFCLVCDKSVAPTLRRFVQPIKLAGVVCPTPRSHSSKHAPQVPIHISVHQRNVNQAPEGSADAILDAVQEKHNSDGYPKLARLMSLNAETAIFRRFSELNMINLLRLQAELHDLEHQLQEIRDEDAQSGDPVRSSYTMDFRLMRDWKETGDSLQYDLLVSIGEKLQQYSLTPLHTLSWRHLRTSWFFCSDTALSQALELSKAGAPNDRELDFLRNWFIKPSMGNDFLNDIERSIWDKPNTPDLVTLFPRILQRDFLTSRLDGILLDIYDRVWGHRLKVWRLESGAHNIFDRRCQQQSSTPGFRKYNEARIATISNSVGAILSSLLPTVAILALYFVQQMLVRIGLTIVFTSVFSLALSLLTDAKKVEIFSATAA